MAEIRPGNETPSMKTLTVLGSTARSEPTPWTWSGATATSIRCIALVAGQNIDLLASQILEFRPKVAVVATSEGVSRLSDSLTAVRPAASPTGRNLLWGDAARVAVRHSAEVDTVISAIVGVAGLEAPTRRSGCGKRVGLANKEVLVSGGKLVMDAVRECGAELIPVDSEHNGAHQCLRAGNREEVSG